MDVLCPPAIPPKSLRPDASHREAPGKKPGIDINSNLGLSVEISAWVPEAGQQIEYLSHVPGPENKRIPHVLRGKSKQDLANVLAEPLLLHALARSPGAIHQSSSNSRISLYAWLAKNIELAGQLMQLESGIVHRRSSTQSQLLSTRAVERHWRQKQFDMDIVLAPFSPASLYQSLAQGVHEQSAVCYAMEESFIENGTVALAALEKEVIDWVRSYKEAKTLYYFRQERKHRWDEGRVGGWR
ncbi:hypothetical protein ACRALDRAFT_1042420 [Sodiomyces alcalophilus JCM 7366]|uniref:uncharacterized protein n=1 Tax=Sodiomyces alcalophilus JCM 7366 TaxID=591952 RepID=UPI0039B67CB3